MKLKQQKRNVIKDNKAFYAVTHAFKLVRVSARDPGIIDRLDPLLDGKFDVQEESLLKALDYHYYQTALDREKLYNSLGLEQKPVIEAAITGGILPQHFSSHVENYCKNNEIENIDQEKTIRELHKIHQAYGLSQSIIPEQPLKQKFLQTQTGTNWQNFQNNLNIPIPLKELEPFKINTQIINNNSQFQESILNATDHKGNTLLHYAMQNGHADVIEYLFNLGASVDIKNHDDQRPLDLLKDKNLLLEKKLHFAALNRGNLSQMVGVFGAIKDSPEQLDAFFRTTNDNLNTIFNAEGPNGSNVFHLLARDLVVDPHQQCSFAKAMVDHLSRPNSEKEEIELPLAHAAKTLDLKRLQTTLLKKDSNDEYPIVTAMKLAEKKHQELEAVKLLSQAIDQAFKMVVDHLVTEISKQDENDEDYENLNNKLCVIHDAMNRLRRGDARRGVIQEVLADPIINETRYWFWPFKTKTHRLTLVAASILEKLEFKAPTKLPITENLSNDFHLAISRFQYTDVTAKCNTFNQGFCDGDLGLLVTPDQRHHSPFEAPLQMASQFEKEKQKYLDRIELVQEAFQLVTNYLKRQLARYDRDSGQYKKLCGKLSVINTKIEELMSATDCDVKQIVDAIQALKDHQDIKAHRDIGLFRVSKTVQQLEKAQRRLSRLSQ